MELVEFLLARIAEDEAIAFASQAVDPTPWKVADDSYAGATVYSADLRYPDIAEGSSTASKWEAATASHVVRHDPARVLAECEAKRRIIRFWPDSFGQWDADQADAARQQKIHSLRALALPYADHPDYDESWRP